MHNSIAEAFERQVEMRPCAIAIEAGGRTLTYRELDEQSNRLASEIRALGAGRGDRIGVVSQRGLESIIAALGTIKAGGAYVPLDPESPVLRTAGQLNDADAKILIAPQGLAACVAEIELPRILIDRELENLAGSSPDPHDARCTPDDLYAVLFTSGSTGRPKGVALEHRNMLNLLDGAPELRPLPQEGALQLCAPQFDVAGYELWATLLSGARLVCHPPGRPDPWAVLETIRTHDVGWAAMATTAFHQLTESGPEQLASMRIVLTGGEALLPRCARRFLTACPSTRLFNIYGPTETTVFVCAHEVSQEVISDDPIPVGRAVAGARLYVVDEQGHQLAAGERGELWVGGPGITRGYLNQPGLNAERYGTDPFAADGGRIYRSGDVVLKRDDGVVEIFGRTDDQLKLSGYRVDPDEISSVLTSHPEVKEGVVLAREDLSTSKRLIAYLVPTNGTSTKQVDENALRRFMAERLPRYMLPSAFVAMEQLPRTTNGKVDRAGLLEPARNGTGFATTQIAPHPEMRSPLTDAAAEIFAQVMGLEQVGSQEDFFDLGGDSLLAVQVLARLRSTLEVELPLSAVFDAPTPAALAALVANAPRNTAEQLPPLRERELSGPVPASAGQAKALMLSELAQESLPYQSQAMHRIVGTLDVGALERSLSTLVQRHEILRTTFSRERGGWIQRVHEPPEIRLQITDLSSEPNPEQALERHFEAACQRRLDPERLPLARWSLARLGPEHHAFIAIEHHVVHDGVSTALFLSELRKLYEADLQGRSEDGQSRLRPQTVQYRDFVIWQRELAESEHGIQTLNYWRERLMDAPSLELPLDKPRPPRQTYRGRTLRMALPSSLEDGIRQRARDWSVTPFMLMLAAHCALLARYGNAEELVIGSGLANRRTLASEELVGMLVNTVALRIDLSGRPTTRELVRRVRTVVLEAQTHQDVPFERVVEHLAPARTADAAPFYQTLFSFHDAPVTTIALPGAKLIPHDALSNGSAKADLSMIVINRNGDGAPERIAEDGLTLVWEYNTDLFEQASAQRMLDDYKLMLEHFAADGEHAERTLSSLPLEDKLEQERRFAGPTSSYERDETIAEIFSARVKEDPKATALSFEGETVSYLRLERWSNRLAHRLRTLGVQRGTRVGICMERSLELIAAFLAVAKAGGTYVPLDPMDPLERRSHLARTLGIQPMLTLKRHREEMPGPVASIICLDDELDLGRELDTPPPSDAGALDPAYIMFTSGSTGAPKGVEVPHRAISRLVRDPDYVDLGPRRTLLSFAPAAFDASTFELWGALLNGGKVILAPPGPLAPNELAELVAKEGVDTLWLTAGLFHRIVDDRPEMLGSIEQLLAGGDVLSPDHVRRALYALPHGGVLVNGYGPTEATTFSCAHRLSAGDHIDGSIPIGRPIAGTRVYILGRDGEPLPIGVPGELFIGGDGVALGYADEPQLTSERFIEDPFAPGVGARMYRSGDEARWRPDGAIDFLGRVDRQLKIRGFRIEPGEVEAALRSHPEIADVYVAPFERNAGDRGLAAYVIARNDTNPSDAQLRAHVAQLLPTHAIPSAWSRIEKLPLNLNGKIDAAALPQPSIGVGTNHVGTDPEDGSGSDVLENKLIAIWQRVLDVDEMGPDEDFFDLGGHSLLAVELFDAIERSLGRQLPLATIFEAPTVRGLARILREDGWESERDSLVILNPLSLSPKVTASRPPLFFVSAGDGNSVGYGALARRLGAEQPFFALQPRGLDGGAPLHRSVEAMAAHYVKVVRRTWRDGPYLLGGRCLGSLVAYEMARRLKAAGVEVALLVVLDSGGPLWQARPLADGTPYDRVMNSALRREGKEFGDVFGAEGTERLLDWLSGPVLNAADGTVINRYLHEVYSVRSDVRDAYPDLTERDAAEFVNWAWYSGRGEMGLTERLLPPPPDPLLTYPLPNPSVRERLASKREELRWRAAEATDLLVGEHRADAGARRRRRVQEASSRAAVRYLAGPYKGPIHLIRSGEYRVQPLLERWYALDTAGVIERSVPGTHRSMLREPDVGGLAECVAELVEEATAHTLRK